MKAAFHLGAQAALGFNRPKFAARLGQQQVHFGTVAGSVKVPLHVRGRVSQQVFNRKTFPTRADHRVGKQRFLGLDVQQGMHHSAAAYIGGCQVLKKWLSYWEQRVLGRALKMTEIQEVIAMARRFAALELLRPRLDKNYQQVAGATWLPKAALSERVQSLPSL